MRKLSLAVLIAVLFAALGLAGCGGGGGSAGNKGGGGGGTTGDTIVTGVVMDDRSPAQPVANVAITLGSAGSTVTNASGRFTFDVGTASVASLFGYDPTRAYFQVSTHLLPTDQYPQVNVFYRGVGYEQIAELGGASIPLFEGYAVQGTTYDVGTITVRYNDPANPPPFPF